MTGSDVVSAVSICYGIPEESIRGRGRQVELVEARHVAMFVMWQDTDLTLKGIGRVLDGRDHSTVLNGVRWVQARPRLADEIKAVRFHATTNRVHLTPQPAGALLGPCPCQGCGALVSWNGRYWASAGWRHSCIRRAVA